jgi:hypothetical protein
MRLPFALRAGTATSIATSIDDLLLLNIGFGCVASSDAALIFLET